MRTKILVLGLILLAITFCKKGIENPYSTDPSELLNLPTIDYFTTISTNTGRWQTTRILKWKVTHATKVEIDNGIGEVALEGMKEIAPYERTTYVLTATNNNGQVQGTCKAGYTAVWMFSGPKGEPGSGDDYQYYYVTGVVGNAGSGETFNTKVSVDLYNYYGTLLASGECLVGDGRLAINEQVAWSIKIDDADGNLRQRMTSTSWITYEITWDNAQG